MPQDPSQQDRDEADETPVGLRRRFIVGGRNVGREQVGPQGGIQEKRVLAVLVVHVLRLPAGR